MKAHLIGTHLLVARSRSSAKVKVKYQGHVFQEMGVSGALVFHKHILMVIALLVQYVASLSCWCKTWVFCKVSDITLDIYWYFKPKQAVNSLPYNPNF